KSPEQTISQERRCRCLKCGEHFAVEPVWHAMEAQAQVPIRIAVPDKEPTVRRARMHHFLDHGLHYVAQHLVNGCRAGVQLGVQPLRSWWKRATAGGDRETRTHGCRTSRNWFLDCRRFTLSPCLLLSNKGYDNLMYKAALGSAHAELIGTGKHLDQR